MDESYTGQGVEPAVEKMAEQEWQKYISNKAWNNIAPSLSKRMFTVFSGYLNDRPKAEIAKELDVTINTVEVYKKRVRQKLCEEIIRLERELNT